MKKLNLISFLLLIGISNLLKAQSDISGIGIGHAGTTSAYYIGWDVTTNFPLEIRHDAAQPIYFYTNFLKRMTIDGTTGNVGIGTTLDSLL